MGGRPRGVICEIDLLDPAQSRQPRVGAEEPDIVEVNDVGSVPPQSGNEGGQGAPAYLLRTLDYLEGGVRHCQVVTDIVRRSTFEGKDASPSALRELKGNLPGERLLT